ncbi:hypothetical protein [Flavobacterium sp.]|uniref:hypothetical protein n=1 Tax=Flavobacterium sp. TaxID=239 RepID=UPI0011FE8EC1|nr:hypothetical protein [Flavobacterium sp.]RZJ70857.1 MAG: hypothetical protein EOO49_12005 [Flavobacterium sp.]
MKQKVIAALVNYGDEQLEYLEQVVTGLKSFVKYDVTVIVNSNIPLAIDGIDQVNVVKLENYQLLPLTCRKVLWDAKDGYDIFIYGENDHLFTENHIDKHLEYAKILPENMISGLIQYEENGQGKFYPGYHFDFEWDFKSVRTFAGKKFASFSNLHQATFILTKKQLEKAGKHFDFTQLVDDFEPSLVKKAVNKLKRKLNFAVDRTNKYSVKCKVNTDVYQYAGMKKVICVSEFDQNIIHHLPNLYIEGIKGRSKLRSDDEKMNASLSRLNAQ